MPIPSFFNPMGTPPPPPVYTPLQYLSSSGGQYINTRIVLRSNITAYLDAEFMAAGGAFGWPAGPDSTMNGCGVEVLQDGFRFWLTDTKITLNPFTRHTYTDDASFSTKKHTFGADGVSGSVSFGQSALIGIYCLFGNQARNGASMRIYSAKIYQAGVLVRDFVPMLDPAGMPCMFDNVEGVPYYNAGTGEFTYA